MLKRLRIKFVFTNMLIVSIILGIIFAFVLYSTQSNLEQDNVQMLQHALEEKKHQPDKEPLPAPQDKDAPKNKSVEDKSESMLPTPYFIIELNDDGEAQFISGNYTIASDGVASLTELAQAAQAAETQYGILHDFGLRYMKSDSDNGIQIAFTDVTREQTTLKHLVKSCLLIGSVSFIALFFLSLLLAHWAVKPVDKAWKQQKQFVADASHELKTPLTVIMTNAELLNPSEYNPANQQCLDNILVMSEQMRGLVERLLDLARIDNGSVKMDFHRVSLSEIVQDAVLPFEPIFFEKGLPLSSSIEPNISINGSSAHLKQIVYIFLDNAQKYATPAGQISVTLTCISRSRCRLEVSNQGDAISREDIKNIFKRFYRADKVRAMNHSYGLGLPIAQTIVQEHHGHIGAESKEGWNTFFAEFPTRL